MNDDTGEQVQSRSASPVSRMIPMATYPLDIYAYSFQSDLILTAMLARLTEEGSLRWRVRDNDNWGEYLAARPIPAPYSGSVRIIAEPDHFVVNVKIRLFDEDAKDGRQRRTPRRSSPRSASYCSTASYRPLKPAI